MDRALMVRDGKPTLYATGLNALRNDEDLTRLNVALAAAVGEGAVELSLCDSGGPDLAVAARTPSQTFPCPSLPVRQTGTADLIDRIIALAGVQGITPYERSGLLHWRVGWCRTVFPVEFSQTADERRVVFRLPDEPRLRAACRRFMYNHWQQIRARTEQTPAARIISAAYTLRALAAVLLAALLLLGAIVAWWVAFVSGN